MLFREEYNEDTDYTESGKKKGERCLIKIAMEKAKKRFYGS